jgi:ribosomal-protein-alanine N-acetyltransferase
MTLDEAFTRLATLTSGRLCIRQMQIDDTEAVFAFKSDPEVTRQYGQEPHRTKDETGAWLQRRVSDYEDRDAIFWVITLKDDDAAIGECCFWNFDPGFHCAEIGYELDSKYWHRGLMTEALSEVLAYGFAEMGLHRIEANPLKINVGSRKLLLRLGFKEEGILRERHFFENRFEDQFYYGLLSTEWAGRNARTLDE